MSICDLFSKSGVMKMKKNRTVIFCFSGSGNCLDISKTIARVLGNTDIVMLRSKPVVTDVYYAKTVGFVFPCYAGGLPDRMEEYVKMLRVNPSSYKFGIVSFQNHSGFGLCQIHDIFELDYWQEISGIDSTVRLTSGKLPGFRKKEEKSNARMLEEAAHAAERIKARTRLEGHPHFHVYGYLESKLWWSYAEKARKKHDVNSKCDGCGICVDVCPQRCISIKNGIAVIGDGCTLCASCLQFCPKGAIDMGLVYERWVSRHNPNVTIDEMNSQVLHFD